MKATIEKIKYRKNEDLANSFLLILQRLNPSNKKIDKINMEFHEGIWSTQEHSFYIAIGEEGDMHSVLVDKEK